MSQSTSEGAAVSQDASNDGHPEASDTPLLLLTRGVPVVHIAAALKHVSTGAVVVVACTHLKAKDSEQCEAVRAQQISAVLDAVQDVATQVRMPVTPEGGQCRCVVMGDFNAEACSSSTGIEAVAVPAALAWGGGCLSSVYRRSPLCDVAGGHGVVEGGLYTTWKSRKGKVARRTIDYILSSTGGGLEVAGLLLPPAEEEIASSVFKLPDMRYPSDHIAIAADIDIVM